MMTAIRIVLQIVILYLFYYIGVFIVKGTNIPLPPSVVGLLLLFFCLQRKWIKVGIIRDGASFLIAFMTLFFIPPIIGILEYPELLSLEGIILLVSVLLSTLFAIYITSILSKKIEEKEKGGEVIERNHIHH